MNAELIARQRGHQGERAGFVVAVRLGETVSRFPLQNGRNPIRDLEETILIFHLMAAVASGVGVR